MGKKWMCSHSYCFVPQYFLPQVPRCFMTCTVHAYLMKLSSVIILINLPRLNRFIKNLATVPLSHSTIDADVHMSCLLNVQALSFRTSPGFELVQAGGQIPGKFKRQIGILCIKSIPLPSSFFRQHTSCSSCFFHGLTLLNHKSHSMWFMRVEPKAEHIKLQNNHRNYLQVDRNTAQKHASYIYFHCRKPVKYHFIYLLLFFLIKRSRSKDYNRIY